MSDPLFTVCLDYRGGTYISQVRSETMLSGIKSWAENVPAADLETWKLHREDLQSLAASDIVAVDTLMNVFCISTTRADKELMLAHVIETRG